MILDHHYQTICLVFGGGPGEPEVTLTHPPRKRRTAARRIISTCPLFRQCNGRNVVRKMLYLTGRVHRQVSGTTYVKDRYRCWFVVSDRSTLIPSRLTSVIYIVVDVALK